MCVGAVIAVAVATLIGLAVGFWLGRSRPRAAGSGTGRPAAGGTAMTVAETLSRTVSLAPVGMVVVDSLRDVVVSNRRAAELGLVRDGLLDDRVWAGPGQGGRTAGTPRKKG